jgi:hypothetical protein
LAYEVGNAGAAVTAVMAKARLCGLLTQKVEVGSPGSFSRAEALDAIERRHGPEVREMLAKALGDLRRMISTLA